VQREEFLRRAEKRETREKPVKDFPLTALSRTRIMLSLREVEWMKRTNSLEERIRLNRLYDLYGALLTERQRQAYEMHEWEDWSLQEISEHLHVSRQGVHDLLSRAKEKLSSFEDLLGMDAKRLGQEHFLEELEALLGCYEKKLPQGFLEALNMLLERGGVSHV
jgi:predicted DNA-binding protein YlxM (UPF0122 family)